jgi:hypothetical protein
MSDITDQPPPIPQPDQKIAWDLVITDLKRAAAPSGDLADVEASDLEMIERIIGDMRERDRLGRERYGTPLTANNGRDHLIDAYQEVLDGSVYLRAEIEERPNPALTNLYNRVLLLIVAMRSMLDERSQ